MNKLLQLIGDGEQPSTLRVAVLIIIAPVMTVWTVLSIKQNQFIIPDAKILALVVSALGSKALQAFAERDPKIQTLESIAAPLRSVHLGSAAPLPTDYGLKSQQKTEVVMPRPGESPGDSRE